MSRGTQENVRSLISFAYGTVTLYGGPFQVPSAKDKVCNSLGSTGVSPGISYNTSTT